MEIKNDNSFKYDIIFGDPYILHSSAENITYSAKVGKHIIITEDEKGFTSEKDRNNSNSDAQER